MAWVGKGPQRPSSSLPWAGSPTTNLSYKEKGSCITRETQQRRTGATERELKRKCSPHSVKCYAGRLQCYWHRQRLGIHSYLVIFELRVLYQYNYTWIAGILFHSQGCHCCQVYCFISHVIIIYRCHVPYAVFDEANSELQNTILQHSHHH